MDEVKDESKPAEHGFIMGMDPAQSDAPAKAPDASGVDGEPVADGLEFIGTMEIPAKKPEPETPKVPEAPSHQAKIVGAKAVKETTEEEFTSFIVGLYNTETKEYEEYFVPRNTLKLLDALENTVKNKGEAYAKTSVKIFKIVPNQDHSGKVLALKLQLIDATLEEAIDFVKKYMIAAPEVAFQALLRNSEPVFESSDAMFIDVIAYFKGKGCTGTTVMSPYAAITEEDVVRYYNAMLAHADMFKSNMAKQGFDIDKKQSIIIPPKGFIPPKGLSGAARKRR